MLFDKALVMQHNSSIVPIFVKSIGEER